MKNVLKAHIVFLLAALSACASAPFYDSTTARSLGKSKTLFVVGGQAASGSVIQLAHGISKELDLGFQIEVGSLFSSTGFFAKYALINPEDDGFALAVLMGFGGTGARSKYGFAGLGISHKFGCFEPALFARYNAVSTEEGDEAERDWRGKEFSYGFLNPTLSFWINEKMAIAVNMGIVLGGPGVWHEAVAASGGLSYQVNF